MMNVHPNRMPQRLNPLSRWCARDLTFFNILASRFESPGGNSLYEEGRGQEEEGTWRLGLAQFRRLPRGITEMDAHPTAFSLPSSRVSEFFVQGVAGFISRNMFLE